MPAVLEGRIFDARTKEPVKGVRVFCMGSIATTDENGFYRVTPPPGTAYMVLHRLEYYPTIVKVEGLQDAQTTVKDAYIERIMEE